MAPNSYNFLGEGFALFGFLLELDSINFSILWMTILQEVNTSVKFLSTRDRIFQGRFYKRLWCCTSRESWPSPRLLVWPCGWSFPLLAPIPALKLLSYKVMQSIGFSSLICGFVKSCKYVVSITVKLVDQHSCVVGLDCSCLVGVSLSLRNWCWCCDGWLQEQMLWATCQWTWCSFLKSNRIHGWLVREL